MNQEEPRSPRTAPLRYSDPEFLASPELRPVRLQLELQRVEQRLVEEAIDSIIVVFGSARFPRPPATNRSANDDERGDSESDRGVALRPPRRSYYAEAQRLAALVSSCCQTDRCECVIATGGGPGIMEAANRGAHEIGKKTLGFNIRLPHEQAPNPFITPGLSFEFEYFAIRKMHFLLRAAAVVIFPGGFGTLDELFEVLTLIQTGKMQPIPVILFGRRFWERVIDFDALIEEQTIEPSDLDLITWVDSADEAWEVIRSAPTAGAARWR